MVRASPLVEWDVWLPFNSGKCTVISLGEKIDSWSGEQRQILSVVIYHTLFSHNEEQFHQTGFKREGKKERRENLKTLFYKDCSLGSEKANN